MGTFHSAGPLSPGQPTPLSPCLLFVCWHYEGSSVLPVSVRNRKGKGRHTGLGGGEGRVPSPPCTSAVSVCGKKGHCPKTHIPSQNWGSRTACARLPPPPEPPWGGARERHSACLQTCPGNRESVCEHRPGRGTSDASFSVIEIQLRSRRLVRNGFCGEF